MEMGSLTHFKVTDKRFKQTSYFQDFKRESLYIRWVNDKIGLFLDDFNKDFNKAFLGETQLEDVFTSDNIKELTSIFRNFLNVKTKCNFHNFDNINFGASSVDNIIQLKKILEAFEYEIDFGFVVGSSKIFNDFFGEFITFTRRIFLKEEEEDYEDDIFDINEHRALFGEIDDDDDDDDDFKNRILSILDTDNETDSDSDGDSESESESD